VYIANETAPGSGEFICMHGPTECAGDMQQLCARAHDNSTVSLGRNPRWFEFVLCQDQDPQNIPDNGQYCAQTVGLDWDTIAECMSDGEGASLLSKSAASRSGRNQSVSCTIYLDDKMWCQHNGVWVDCEEGTESEDMTAAVCKRYTGTNPPPACNEARKRADQQQKWADRLIDSMEQREQDTTEQN